MMTSPDGTKYYTFAEAAEKYNVSESNLYEAHRQGHLKARVRKGTTKPYFLSDDYINEWFAETGFVEVG